MSLAVEVRFQGFRLDLARRDLTRDGAEVRLGGRALDLLICLVERRDRIVSPEEIMDIVWDGVLVEDSNLYAQVAALRRVVGKDAVVTVPRRGVRFGYPIEGGAARGAGPGVPAVAVLPFDLGGAEDAEDAAARRDLADALVEDITTELARYREFTVISRASAFSFRGQGAADRDVSEALGVRYLVEGSLRAGTGRVRISARLVDAARGEVIWAERFDRVPGEAAGDRLDLAEDIAQALAGAIAPQIRGAESRKARRSAHRDGDAYALARRAWSLIWDNQTRYDPDLRGEVLALVEAALAAEPETALAHRARALAAFWEVYHNTSPDRDRWLQEGIAAAGHAIALDAGDHHAWRTSGLLHCFAAEYDIGLSDLRRAVELAPSCATSLGWLAMFEASFGEAGVAMELAEAAVRISPRDPARTTLLVLQAFSAFVLRRYDDAVRAGSEAIRHDPETASPYVVSAISCVAAGRIDEGRACFARLEALAPRLAEARLGGTWLAAGADYQERATLFLRIAAGLEPETAAEGRR